MVEHLPQLLFNNKGMDYAFEVILTTLEVNVKFLLSIN